VLEGAALKRLGKMPDTTKRLTIRLNERSYSVAAVRPESAAFWADAAAGRWEDETFRFLDAVIKPDAVLIDVGAWIGPLSLYASPRVARVIALEPDPIAHAELVDNVADNAPNVEIWNAAINLTQGELKLFAPKGFGNSETTSSGEGEAVTVKTVTFAEIDAAVGVGAPVVLKVDIEGHEYRVLDAMIAFAKKRNAPVHLSLHPRSIWNGERKRLGWFGARQATFDATIAAVEKLAQVGAVTMSSTGAPATRAEVFRLMFLKKRPKNFSIEVRAPR
jgi:FkbM family methyltransferase